MEGHKAKDNPAQPRPHKPQGGGHGVKAEVAGTQREATPQAGIGRTEGYA
jgi:hypothetical protein